MPPKNNNVLEDLQHLFPLTPAVFFILFALAQGEKHGYAIMQQVSVLSDGKVRMGPGTLYTTIQRLLELALIEEIDADPGGRRRYYRLTRTGKVVFKAEVGRMDAVVRLALQRRRPTFPLRSKLAPVGTRIRSRGAAGDRGSAHLSA
jgi:DNA-binding PadR family transcriptional regulator